MTILGVYIPGYILVGLGFVAIAAVMAGAYWLKQQTTGEYLGGQPSGRSEEEIQQSLPPQENEYPTEEEPSDEDETTDEESVSRFTDTSEYISLKKGDTFFFETGRQDITGTCTVIGIDDSEDEMLVDLFIQLPVGSKLVDIDRHMSEERNVGLLGFVITYDPPGLVVGQTYTYDQDPDDPATEEGFAILIEEIYVEVKEAPKAS
jgi:hypothetical protein